MSHQHVGPIRKGANNVEEIAVDVKDSMGAKDVLELEVGIDPTGG